MYGVLFCQVIILTCLLWQVLIWGITGIVRILRYIFDVELITKEKIRDEWSFEGVPARIQGSMWRHERPSNNQSKIVTTSTDSSDKKTGEKK